MNFVSFSMTFLKYKMFLADIIAFITSFRFPMDWKNYEVDFQIRQVWILKPWRNASPKLIGWVVVWNGWLRCDLKIQNKFKYGHFITRYQRSFWGLSLTESKAITDGGAPADVNVDTQELDTEIPRVFFTHLPLELLPKSALDGGVKVHVFTNVLLNYILVSTL